MRAAQRFFAQMRKSQVNAAPTLVERVGYAIGDVLEKSATWEHESRAAIRVVAAWLRKHGWELAATTLEREVE